MAASTFDMNQRIAAALGIDLTTLAVTHITLHFDAQDNPTAVVTVRLDEGEELVTELHRYHLTETTQEPTP